MLLVAPPSRRLNAAPARAFAPRANVPAGQRWPPGRRRYQYTAPQPPVAGTAALPVQRLAAPCRRDGGSPLRPGERSPPGPRRQQANAGRRDGGATSTPPRSPLPPGRRRYQWPPIGGGTGANEPLDGSAILL
ncbi:MAG TPA: hypothetical protein VH599_01245 [Ktedonobacterales bacterium]